MRFFRDGTPVRRRPMTRDAFERFERGQRDRDFARFEAEEDRLQAENDERVDAQVEDGDE